MSIPPRLAGRLNETLGPAAAGDFVTWLDETRAEHAELRADMAELRQEIRASELRLESNMDAKLAGLQAAIGGQIAALATDLRKEIHVVDNKIERRFSDLILWSFVFWVGAVAAIAVLAGALKP